MQLVQYVSMSIPNDRQRFRKDRFQPEQVSIDLHFKLMIQTANLIAVTPRTLTICLRH